MATCKTWPDCVGAGLLCWESCPPNLAGTDNTNYTPERQAEMLDEACPPGEGV